MMTVAGFLVGVLESVHLGDKRQHQGCVVVEAAVDVLFPHDF